jgi:CheY-like chemotaxis protein
VKTKELLIVDDEEIILTLCRRLTAGLPHTIRFATSVGRAVEEIGRRAPDALITDLRLPDGDGLDVIRCLRKVSPGARVAIISGSIAPEDRQLLAAGLDVEDYLSKPFEMDAFRALLAKLLEDRP